MRSRFIPLVSGLLMGSVIALLYGWLVRPIEYIDTSPDSLRIDFRTDYILMVAEAYDGEQDLNLAHFRLAALGPQPPVEYASEAINYALGNSFGRRDLELLNALAIDLRSLPQPGELGAP
jgi:hypothetical protein